MDPESAPIALEEVARAAAELSAQPELDRVLSGFGELVRKWAAPSALVAVARDPDAESGWRLLPALCAGSVPVGADRSVARLVTETPECLARPVVVRGEEIPGVKVRDNVAVPWWCEGASGLLLLRGVPRPFPSNLGDALSLAAAPVWPRLLGSPATRLEALLGELRSASGRLAAEVARHAERLEALRRPETPEPAEGEGRAEVEAELEAVRRQLEGVRTELAAAREARHDDEALAAATARAQDLERALAAATAERQALEERDRDLASRLEAADLELAAAVEARRRADQALAAATDQADERRRVAEAAEARASRAEEELVATQRDLALARARGGRRDETPAGAAEARVAEMSSRWETMSGAVRLALSAARRAAFIPPPLRVSVEAAGALVEPGERPPRRFGIALLDREVVGIEPLASELEAGGVEVRIANQSEELALLLRTPDAVDAVVCDVMSFRPDQNVAGLIRSWDKDRPGLSFYLSYDLQSPAEVERARRIPMSLTAGHIPRPLVVARLLETIENLARRQGRA
jgi:hypothetical protein